MPVPKLRQEQRSEVPEACRCHNRRHRRRRNVLTSWKAAATTVGHGRRNAFTFANCLCRNSWLEGLRHVIPRLPLQQQLALGTPQRRTRQEARDRPSRTQSTPQSIKMCTTCRRDRKAMVGSRGRHSRLPVLSPRVTGDCQPSDPSQCTQPCVPPTRGP